MFKMVYQNIVIFLDIPTGININILELPSQNPDLNLIEN